MSPGNVNLLSAGMAVTGALITIVAVWLGFRMWDRTGRRSFHMPATKPKEVQPINLKDPILAQIVQKGFELQTAGQDREAIRYFEKAIALGGDATETLQILVFTADSYYRLGEYAQAQAKGIYALEIAQVAGAKPEAASAHCILGEAAVKLGEWEAAVEHFNEGADHFSQAGNEKAARRALDRLTELLGQGADPESAEFYRHLASEIRSGESLNSRERAQTQVSVQ
ncbi:tetratricopeptide repeat protein [Variovorax sp. YR216]|uniref:tetratricopeptide repeat protein n=1 Tax=Variovorax sp. YR216 TaxID=1882828 RepID=UPI00089D64FF|nr:tetratricopeptide repeat protein [Variovorax sp. YR216]SEB25271.1 Tetratricopeptide repeat-containing protein [Variovorax sp. YR216]